MKKPHKPTIQPKAAANTNDNSTAAANANSESSFVKGIAAVQAQFKKGPVMQRRATIDGHPSASDSDGNWLVDEVFIEAARPSWKADTKHKLKGRQSDTDPGDEQVIRHIVSWDRLKQSVQSLVRGGDKTYTYLENQLDIHWPDTSVIDNPGKKGTNADRTTEWMNSYLTKYMDAVNNDPANLFYGDAQENSARNNKTDNPFKAAWGPHNKGLLKETEENNFAFSAAERVNVLEEFFDKLEETGNLTNRLVNWGQLHTGLSNGQILTLKKKTDKDGFANYMKAKKRWQLIRSLPGVINRFPINSIPNLKTDARNAKYTLQGKFIDLPANAVENEAAAPVLLQGAPPQAKPYTLVGSGAEAIQRKSTVMGHPNGVNSDGTWLITSVMIESARPGFLQATTDKMATRQNANNVTASQVIRHIMPWADIKMSVVNLVHAGTTTYTQLETALDNHWPATSVVNNPGKPSTQGGLTTATLGTYLSEYLKARNNDPANLFYGNKEENTGLGDDATDNPFKAAWDDHYNDILEDDDGDNTAFDETARENVLKEFFGTFSGMPADEIEKWATRDTDLSDGQVAQVKLRTVENDFVTYMKVYARWKKIIRLPGVLNRVSIDAYEDLGAAKSAHYTQAP